VVLVAAAFAAHPPLIVPELALGAAGELDGLRVACDLAVQRLLGARPDRVVVLGGGPSAARWEESERGSFAGYGVGLTVSLGSDPGLGSRTGCPDSASSDAMPAGPPRLPLSVTVAGWLLGRAGHAGPRYAVTVPAAATDAELAGWARSIVEDGGRLGLLVMGDGSARRSPTAPGYLDPRAAGFDAAAAGALRDGDPARLRSVDPVLGAELLAAGAPAWRLAGQVAAAAGAGRFAAELLYDAAPYGVGYLVAAWVA